MIHGYNQAYLFLPLNTTEKENIILKLNIGTLSLKVVKYGWPPFNRSACCFININMSTWADLRTYEYEIWMVNVLLIYNFINFKRFINFITLINHFM